MKSLNVIKRLAFISLIIFSSCSKSNDSIIGETDDTFGEIGLRFSNTRQKVTFDICDAQYCSIQQLTFLNDNIGYAVTGVDIYKTISGGESWEKVINQDIVGRLIPLNENLMFLNTYDGILKTTNAGVSWSNITRPLDFICSENGNINTGIVQFVDEFNGFVQDKCYKGQLYSTTNSGISWELIYNSDDDISEYYFQDFNNGFVMVNDIIYITQNGGRDWIEGDILPSIFDYVIEKENLFLFPEGTAEIYKPEIIDANITITKFDVNEKGDIAIILYDQSVAMNNWKLMLYVNEEEIGWMEVDQLGDLTDELSVYSSIDLTNDRSIYIGISRSGDILKYYID